MDDIQHKCVECDNVYKHAFTLNRHIRLKHASQNEKCGIKSGVVCSLCGVECISKNALKDHLASYHDCVVEQETLNFSSEADFLVWKSNIEKESVSSFVKNRGSTISNDIKTSRFYCHRSGHFSSRGAAKRKLKIMGSNKINGICPAMFTVKEDKKGINVVYIKTHLGHSNDLGKLKFSETKKKSIAAKLANKVPITTVLDEIRDSILGYSSAQPQPYCAPACVSTAGSTITTSVSGQASQPPIGTGLALSPGGPTPIQSDNRTSSEDDDPISDDVPGPISAGDRPISHRGPGGGRGGLKKRKRPTPGQSNPHPATWHQFTRSNRTSSADDNSIADDVPGPISAGDRPISHRRPGGRRGGLKKRKTDTPTQAPGQFTEIDGPDMVPLPQGGYVFFCNKAPGDEDPTGGRSGQTTESYSYEQIYIAPFCYHCTRPYKDLETKRCEGCFFNRYIKKPPF